MATLQKPEASTPEIHGPHAQVRVKALVHENPKDKRPAEGEEVVFFLGIDEKGRDTTNAEGEAFFTFTEIPVTDKEQQVKFAVALAHNRTAKQQISVKVPAGPKKEKKPRLKVSPGDEEIHHAHNKYKVTLETLDKDGKPDAATIFISCDDKVTIMSAAGETLASDVTSWVAHTASADDFANNQLKGTASLLFTFTGFKRVVKFMHTETREELKKTFHLK
jgi:hypothetical protein